MELMLLIERCPLEIRERKIVENTVQFDNVIYYFDNDKNLTGYAKIVSEPILYRFQHNSLNTLTISCPVGTYTSGAIPNGTTGMATVCKSCATGKFNDQQGQTSESSCKTCALGKYQNQNGQPSCKLCVWSIC